MRNDPRHVYVVSFDTANTDLKYFCSHPDQMLAGVAEADIFRGDIVNASTKSQKLNPIRANASIGSISFTFVDDNGAFSSLLNSKLLAGDGLRAKRVQHWIGEKGAEWPSDYELLQTHQIHDAIEITQSGLGYKFTGRDIQRSQLENIFEPKVTNLTASVGKTDITINVNSTTGIDLIQHGASYSDAPNEKVLYFRIKDEIIRGTAKTSTTFTVDNAQSTLNGALAKDATSIVVADASGFDSSGVGYLSDGGSPATLTDIKWTGKTSNTLTGVTGVTAAHSSGNPIVAANGRGALGTVPAAYDVDTSASVSNRTKVTEHIYYKLPGIKLAYAILTGTLYGSADTIPAHHSLGISTDWISTSEFTQFSDDIWDTADDTAGIILRFSGLKKVNAKKFIEEEINLWCGVFNPVLPTGELGLRKMTGVISDAAHSGILNEDNIIAISGARFDLNDVHNNVSIDWNHDSIQDDYTRHIEIVDTDSQSAWGESKTLELTSKGLHGSIHTDAILGSMFNMWRDRHAGPPFKATLTLDYSQRDIKVGAIKRLQLSQFPNFTDQDGNYSSFDAAVEIQSVTLNPQAGTVTVDVFGSTRKAVPLLLGRADASPIADAWFTSEGSDISGVSTITSSGTPTLTITGGSLVGVADLTSAGAASDNDQGVFYWDGDMIIDGQIDITDNVELRVNGFITCTANAYINGVGGGHAGGTSGTAGALGNTQGASRLGGVVESTTAVSWYSNQPRDLVEGANIGVPSFVIVNDGGADIKNRVKDLRGSSGGSGGDVQIAGGTITVATGGVNGGDGGAGLVIFCKGASGTSGTLIDLSGTDGDEGTLYSSGGTGLQAYAGSAGGGAGGGFCLFLVGNAVSETLSDYFVSQHGDTPIPSGAVPMSDNRVFRYSAPPIAYTRLVGLRAEDNSRANLRVDWVPDNITVESDAAPIAETPTLISFTENSNTPQTPAENLATIDVTVTPPSDTSYSHSMIAYKLATDDDTQFQRLPYPAKNETSVVLSMDGSEYTFRAYPVNKDGVESVDFIQKNFTVSDADGYVGDLTTEEFFKLNSTTGEMTVGREVKNKSASSFTGSHFYYETWFDSIDGNSTSAVGSASATVGAYGLDLYGEANSDAVWTRKTMSGVVPAQPLSWNVKRRLKFWLLIPISLATNDKLYICMGETAPANSNNRAGIQLDSDMNLQGLTADGTTTNTTGTLQTLTAGTSYEIEIVHDPGNDVKIYIDGVLKSTITSNIPSGTNQAGNVYGARALWPSTGAAARHYYIPRLKFWQESQ